MVLRWLRIQDSLLIPKGSVSVQSGSLGCLFLATDRFTTRGKIASGKVELLSHALPYTGVFEGTLIGSQLIPVLPGIVLRPFHTASGLTE
jgi:hypothetical protein